MRFSKAKYNFPLNVRRENSQFAGVEVSSGLSFQGVEKDVIILVALKPVDGFAIFNTKESLLIALTRAKQSLIICGNFQNFYMANDPMSITWKTLMSNAKFRKRFFDLNGTFDGEQVNNALVCQRI